MHRLRMPRRRMRRRPRPSTASPPLADIPAREWRVLSERAVEPNGSYLPGWALAGSGSARGRTGASALSVWSDAPLAYDGPPRLIGLLPAISLWRAQKIP